MRAVGLSISDMACDHDVLTSDNIANHMIVVLGNIASDPMESKKKSKNCFHFFPCVGFIGWYSSASAVAGGNLASTPAPLRRRPCVPIVSCGAHFLSHLIVFRGKKAGGGF